MVTLLAGSDYTFAYNSGTNVIALTPLAPLGASFGNGSYEISLSSAIEDLANNALVPALITVVVNTALPTIVVFQNGLGGYAGTLDTYVHEDEPTTNHGGYATVRSDGDDDLGTGETQAQEVQGLIRFNNLFQSGGGASRVGGPIPDGATILSAILTVRTGGAANDNSPSLFNLHRMIATWDENATWNSMNVTPGGVVGISRDDSEASSAITASAQYQGTGGTLQPNVNVLGGAVTFDVTADLQLWSSNNALSTRGWLIHPDGVALNGNPVSGQTDGWVFDSSEAATIANRPMLVVTYSVPNPSTVTGRRLFYNNSIWDDTNFGFTNASAIAGDKTAYVPNGSNTSTFASMSSYSKGINGIMVEVTGAPGTLTSADFTIKMSGQGFAANNTPSTWTAAPAFSVTRVANTPTTGTDRYELVWADGAITNRYLYVVVEGNDALGGNNTNTGLAASDYFFFGSMIGDMGTPEFYPNVNATDQVQVRNNQGVLAPPTGVLNLYDFNRDALVDATDQIIARNNQGVMPWLNLSAPPSAPDGGGGNAIASALAIGGGGWDEPAVVDLTVLLDDADNAAAPEDRHLKMPANGEGSILRVAPSGDSDAVDLALDDELLDSLLDCRRRAILQVREPAGRTPSPSHLS
jgi:hypothetical protein